MISVKIGDKVSIEIKGVIYTVLIDTPGRVELAREYLNTDGFEWVKQSTTQNLEDKG